MSMAAIGIAGLGVGAVGLGFSAYQYANQPGQPNLMASSAELANTQASLLPIQRMLQAAAMKGGKVTVDLPEHYESRQMTKIPAGYSTRVGRDAKLGGLAGASGVGTGAAAGATYGSVMPGIGTAVGAGIGAIAGLFDDRPKFDDVEYKEDEWKEGGKYYGLTEGGTKQPVIKTRQIKVPAGPKTYDFSGYGESESQGIIAKEMARIQLGIAKKYDPQFIAESLKQEKEADPEGWAARERERELIKQQAGAKPDQPVADQLEKQIGEQVAAGKGLDQFDQDTLNAAAKSAMGARGGATTGADFGVADFAEPLTTGFEGNRRELESIQKATQWLGSGLTPEDVLYRRRQQDMTNLEALTSGRTPTSEFASLSAAGSGPTPTVSGPALPTMPGGGVRTAGSAALDRSGIQMNNASQQANPWFAGLSTILSGAGAAANLGWRPFAGTGK
jgi:hypothetical protein